MATYSWNFTTRATCTVFPVDTPTLHTDWLIAAPRLLRLVTCSLSAILLSSSRLISSSLRWGPFSCCLTISRSFLCCWERRVTGKREMSTEAMFAQGNHMDSLLISKLSFVFYAKSWKIEIKGAVVQGRELRSWVILTNAHTYLLHPNHLLSVVKTLTDHSYSLLSRTSPYLVFFRGHWNTVWPVW